LAKLVGLGNAFRLWFCRFVSVEDFFAVAFQPGKLDSNGVLAEDAVVTDRTIAAEFDFRILVDGKCDVVTARSLNAGAQRAGFFFHQSDYTVMEVGQAARKGFFIGQHFDGVECESLGERHCRVPPYLTVKREFSTTDDEKTGS
jgi:hypothetical protein